MGRTDAGRVGAFAGWIVCLLGAAYGLVLAASWRSVSGGPITGLPFALLEVLILLIAPAMVVLFAAVQVAAAPQVRTFGVLGLIFASLAAGLSAAVHFTILTNAAALAAGAFVWPSIPYALDVLAWDGFFPLAAAFAAFSLGGSRGARRCRALLLAASGLAAAGLVGAAIGDLRLRNVGVLGYAVIFPISAAGLALLFGRRR